MLEKTGSIPLDDYDGHVGAFTLLVDHLRQVAADPPDRIELKRRVGALASRPGFDLMNPHCQRSGRRHWAWIDPRSIARGRALGKPLPRSQYSLPWMADFAQKILSEFESPLLYTEYFDDPREGYGICVSSIAGPWGPIRPIGTNGNHRSMAFEVLESPVVLAEIYEEKPPYGITYDEDEDDWETTLDFLKWQQERKLLRLSSRSIVRDRGRLEIRITDAVAPWLAASPREAMTALDAYERFWDRELDTIGSIAVTEIRQTWKSAARKQLRKRLRERDALTLTLVQPPIMIGPGSQFGLETGGPRVDPVQRRHFDGQFNQRAE